MRALLIVLAVAACRPAAAPTKIEVLITDPAALAEIERAGGALTALLPGARYDAIADTVAADLRAIAKADKQAGVGIRGNAHRLFDARWLRSPKARFELVGVAARLDRIPVAGTRCGDVRLVYRLAYSTDGVSSRLPMTLAVVLRGEPPQTRGDCGVAARRWRVPAAAAGAELGRALIEGGALWLHPTAVSLVLANLQSVRWPSAVRPDLGGHAEYILRAFTPAGDGLAPAGLENTPDAARLGKDKALRAELLAWLRDPAVLDRIDAGTVQLPDRFKAQRVVSVSPRGLARRANRPYRQVIDPKQLADLDLSKRRTIGSPEALLRRLDDLTCNGCHQGRSVAGFHLLGVDGEGAVAGNALALAGSAHMADEEARRRAIVTALADGQPADFTRPFSERGAFAGYGAHCGLGDVGFAAWDCAAGLVCDPFDAPAGDKTVGVCLPAAPAIGDPCEVGPVKPSADPRRDRVARASTRACAAGAACNTNRVGFPGGMCAASCEELPDGAACGAIAQLTPFNNCLARKVPFPRCLADHVFPAALRSCDAARPCRDDYICARTAGGQGACIPPYFLFQMRVDGHAL